MPGFGPGENNFGPEGTNAAGGEQRGRGGRGRGPRGPGGPGPAGADQQAGAESQRPPQQPRLGPDGQPLPPRSKRPRKPIGPDANGLGPDGTPWDPERRAKRLAERQPSVNSEQAPSVEAQTQSAPPQTQTQTQTESPTE